MKSILRGRILSFLTEPQHAEDTDAFTYLEDGALIMEGGKILHLGDFAALAPDRRLGARVIDHRPHLIMPGSSTPICTSPRCMPSGLGASSFLTG